MSFVQPSDPDYLFAKRIKQGRSRLDPAYDGFVERFPERYGISLLAVMLDAVGRPRGQGKTPRLGVVLERTSQYRSFLRSIADQFWCIERFAGPPIVFVHTDEQARALKASALPSKWADTYFEIAKRHDEFGYLNRAEIAIQCYRPIYLGTD